MRPKKKILIIDANENRLSIRRFLLETRGFAVLAAESSEEALRICSGVLPDLTLVVLPIPGAKALLDEIRGLTAGRPAAVLANDLNCPEGQFADATFYEKLTAAAELIERLKRMTMRKPGPRKNSPASAWNSEIELRRLA